MIRTALVLALALVAQDKSPEKSPDALPPLPPDAHVEQTMQ